MLAREVVDRDRMAERDDRVAVALESMEESAEEALEEVIERGLELLSLRRSLFLPQQFLGEIAVFEHAVVVDRGRDDEQRRTEFRIALRGDDVVQHPQLRLLERAVARQAAFDEDPLRDAVPGDGLDEFREDGVIQRLAITPAH